MYGQEPPALIFASALCCTALFSLPCACASRLKIDVPKGPAFGFLNYYGIMCSNMAKKTLMSDDTKSMQLK